MEDYRGLWIKSVLVSLSVSGAVASYLIVPETTVSFLRANWWMTRNNCGWFPWILVTWYMITQGWIWISYERIPRTIRKLESRGITFLNKENSTGFQLFVKLCGRGHLLDGVLVFIWPHYVFFTLWHTATAIVSHQVSSNFHLLAEDLLTAEEKNQIQDELSHIDEAFSDSQKTMGELQIEIQDIKQNIKKIIER